CSNGVDFWDLAGGERTGTLPTQEKDLLRGLAFSPDGQRLAVATRRGTVQMWPPPATKLPPVILRVLEGKVLCVAFSPDGQRLAIQGEDGPIRIWDASSTGQEMRPCRGVVMFGGHCQKVEFTPDGKRLVVLTDETRMPQLCDVTTGQQATGPRG